MWRLRFARLEKVKEHLPDAEYTHWTRIRSALKHAIANPPEKPKVPQSILAGYSGTPLPKKLGIKPNAVVALVNGPENFAQTLGELPEGAVFTNKLSPSYDLILWFARSLSELKRGIRKMAAQVGDGGMWIIWPKKTSSLASDIGEQDVRHAGLAAGLVDYKVCAEHRRYGDQTRREFNLKFTSLPLPGIGGYHRQGSRWSCREQWPGTPAFDQKDPGEVGASA